MNILLVEDDELLSYQISLLLKKERYICDTAYSIAQAKNLYELNNYQLILMDWNLPDGSGIEMLKEIRSYKDSIALIMLSGRESIDERVEALDAGADDYLCKPYSNEELLARMRALLRRESSQKTTKLEHQDMLLDLSKRQVFVADEVKNLTEKEFEILELLMLNKNKVLSRDAMSELLTKNFDAMQASNFVDVHIKNIRKKLQRAKLITSVRGVGYTIRD